MFSRWIVTCALAVVAAAPCQAAWRITVVDGARHRTTFSVEGGVKIMHRRVTATVRFDEKARKALNAGAGFDWLLVENVAVVAGRPAVMSSRTFQACRVTSARVRAVGRVRVVTVSFDAKPIAG